ncbi:phytoene/squalene synthase family protein [Devosia sp.]|uniref:phytoene/squalene synthase family protein n=1 Tax=Devosia sp. TaxID=1871048 RepID=UPI003267B47B
MSAENQRLTGEFLRDKDRDRYLSTLVLSGATRDAIVSLYAFNADVASIRERVSDPAPGEIRLQWWNDALTGEGHGAVRSNPVADCLLDTVKTYAIPTGTLQRLLAARRFDLYGDPMPDLETFEGYAGETTSTLYQLAAMVLNNGAVIEAGDAAGHLGVAHAMIGHLRAFGYNASMGRMFLPWSIFEANGVAERDVFSGTASEGVVEAWSQIAELASGHLNKAEAAIKQLPPPLRPAFATLSVLKAQHRLVLKSSDPFGAAPDLAAWQKIAAMSWWMLTGR